MLRPAKMVKLSIVGSKQSLRPVVEKLYSLQAVHLVEFSEGRDVRFAGFRIGKPMPEGQQASDRLVRLRGISRHLDLATHTPATRHGARDLEQNLDEKLHQIELNITSAAEAKARTLQAADALDKERALLQPLAALPLNLEDYSGYHSLVAFIGKAEASIQDAVTQAVPEAQVFVAPTNHFAVFAPKAKAGKAGEALSRAGAQLIDAPKGQGSVQGRIDAIGTELQQLQTRLESATNELQRLRQAHADFLVAAEEHLSIQAEKAEAPLSFATTENAFVAECWVPEDQVEQVQAALRQAAGDAFHVEVHGPEAHDAHGNGDEASAPGREAAEGHAAAEAHEDDVPPTKFNHARAFRPFQMFTEMVSVPRYGEIDPTPILALVLPLFLGFMIGDAGYGVLMVLVGFYLIRKIGKSIAEARDIGIAMLVAGVVSLFFGAVIFTDAFGIPFFMHGKEIAAGTTCEMFRVEHKETSWGCLLGLEQISNSAHAPVISKLEDIGDLLMISVVAAFVHMAFGLVFGVINSWSHSKKHVLAKIGWFALMVGFFAQILYMAAPALDLTATPWHEGNRVAWALWSGLGIPVSTVNIIGVQFHVLLLGGMVLAAVLLAIGEGPITVMELPTMLSNLMSYTRLAGLAIAKGAMAAAFTSLTLVAMVLSARGDALSLVLALVGLVLFVFTQMFVFVLGVFSSSIQAIRLNYVEFFNKFYTGGGVAFRPFGKQRKYTVEVSK